MRARGAAILGGVASLGALAWVRPWRYRATPSELLDEFLPEYEFRDTVSLEIDAQPRRVLRALRDLRLSDMRLAWLLGELRYLPARIAGSAQPADGEQPFLAMLRTATGTIVLGERADELALGTIGKLHQLTSQEPQCLTGAHCFRDFSETGFEKLAMSLRVTELAPGRCRVTMEHRTHALGPVARAIFGVYWLTIKPMGAFVTWQMLRAVRRRATAAEEPEIGPSAAGSVEVTEVAREVAATFA